MKPILSILLMLSLQHGLLAQSKSTALKVYAYVRETAPGTRPNVVRENGAVVQKETGNVLSWFIFAEVPKGITITQISINGQKIAVKTEKQASTPIVFQRPGIGNQVETDSLVPATRNTVLKLVPAQEITLRTNNTPYSVVVHYTVRGVRKATKPKEFIQLPPLVLQ